MTLGDIKDTHKTVNEHYRGTSQGKNTIQYTKVKASVAQWVKCWTKTWKMESEFHFALEAHRMTCHTLLALPT